MDADAKPELPGFEKARALVESYARTLALPRDEAVPLLDADRRVLAEEIRADRDFPPFDRATRDGFALRAADVANAPARLKVVAEIAAGSPYKATIAAAEAAEIMTGAPLPEGADAVVMVEYTHREGSEVIVQRSVRAGSNFVPRGAEAAAGSLLVRARTRVNPAVVAMAASVGKAQLCVYRAPTVAILATGDELVEVGETPGPAQIRNSNSYSVAAQVRRAGGNPKILPIGRDNESALREALDEAKSADLLILSGGVSMGKYDLVEQVLESEGARFQMTGARIQPGKPIVFGTLPRQAGDLPFFGLPGNPVSTMVTFDLFVMPVLAALGGAEIPPLRFVQAKLKDTMTEIAPGLTRFLPATLEGTPSESIVEIVPWHGSGDMAAVVRANGYLVVLPDRTSLPSGSMVSVLLKD